MWLIYQYLKWLSNFIMSSEINICQQQWVYHTRSSNYFIIWLNLWYDIPTTVYWWNEFSQLVPFLLWGLLWDWLLICICYFPACRITAASDFTFLFWYVGMACSIGTSVWLAVFHDVFYNVACWWCFVMWNCTCLAKLSNIITCIL